MSKSDKLPALQFYPGDWRKDPGVRALKPLERYVWFEMLLVMHEAPERGRFMLGHGPYPIDRFARDLQLRPSFVESTISKLIQFCVATRSESGIIESRRMVRDEDIRVKRKAAGILGGNPNLVNQTASKPEPNANQGGNQKSTPSSSSSISSSKERETPPDLKLWPGCKFIRTTAEEYHALVKLFGHALLKQEIPDADLWIEKADSPNARKYRKPTHNHYLFLRTTWLKDKSLKRDKNFSSNGVGKPEVKISKQGSELVRMAMPKVNL